jgi:predicted nucleotidyltransferase
MSATVTFVAEHMPRLASLLGTDNLSRRQAELARLGMTPLWQVERDLGLLHRYVAEKEARRAYQTLLRNPKRFIDAMYEIRVAAMLAPFCDRLELSPRVRTGHCDLACVIRGERIFGEVTVHPDAFPPAFEGQVYRRVTVEKSFDPTARAGETGLRPIPASKEIRDHVVRKLRQLPAGSPTVLVLGAPNTRFMDVEAALDGDEVIVSSQESSARAERVANGIFAGPDEVGGVSQLSALIAIKLVPSFADVRVQSRLFINPRAAMPLSTGAREVLTRIFDRKAVLVRELERIKRVLVEEYGAERIILFGSVADELSNDVDRIHEWSDIDIAVVKTTSLRFTQRAAEVMELIRPMVAVNVLVYTPEELERAERVGNVFIRDEVLHRGRVLFP